MRNALTLTLLLATAGAYAQSAPAPAANPATMAAPVEATHTLPAAALPSSLTLQHSPTLPPPPTATAPTSGSPALGPTTTVGDEMTHFLQQRGLLARIGDVGAQMTSRASELVLHSMAFLGVPYRRGGTSIDTGFDCSGFVRAIYAQTVGLLLPRQSSEQAAATEKIDKKDLQPGDLVFFNTMRRAFSHVGIYVGNGKFIHSPKPGAEVRVEDMGVGYWAKRFDGARRVPAAEPQKTAAPSAQ